MPIAAPILDSPIVLMHGLFGFDAIGLGPWKMAYFPRLREWLESSGNRVLITRSHPAGRIATRASQVAQQIQDQFGNAPVHLIAHSMGGLDARYLITHLGWSHRVISLTTLGTPHHGSVVADVGSGLVRPEGAAAGLLRLLGWEPEFGVELSRPGCAAFNQQTPDSPSVYYQSVAGIFPNACRRHFRQLPHRVFTVPLLDRFEGPNDGMVSATSARWGAHHEVWAGDHFNLVNWVSSSTRWPEVNATRLPEFAGLLARMRTVECNGNVTPSESAGTDVLGG